MGDIYIRDINGQGWVLGADISGALTCSPAGTLVAAPALVKMNALDGSIANSFQLVVSTDGHPGLSAITYVAGLPTLLNLQWAYGWFLQVTSEPRFVVTAKGYAPGRPYIVYPSLATGLLPAATSPLYILKPITKVPVYSYEAVRHDNRATSGVQETVLERLEKFFEGDYEFLFAGGEAAAWAAFISAVIGGTPFDYHPTGDANVYTTYLMDESAWKPVYRSPGIYRFSMKWYQRVAWP